MSGRGSEPKADRFGSALVALKIAAVFAVFALCGQKTGQVLVRTSAREKATISMAKIDCVRSSEINT